MSNHITSIEIIGLHGQYDYSCDFKEGVNIIYGRNGSGKTTLLHILANVLNGDYLRFAAIDFHRIRVFFGEETKPITIELERIPREMHYHGFIKVNDVRIHEEAFCSRNLEDFFGEPPSRVVNERYFRERELFERRVEKAVISEDVIAQLPEIKLSSAYFPAFRTAIDAWAVNVEEDTGFSREIRPHRIQIQKTKFARSLFGFFVPNFDYPATSEIESNLNNQIRAAIANVSRADRIHLTAVPSRILEALVEPATDVDIESILSDIESLAKRFQEYPIQVDSTWDKLSQSVNSVSKDDQDYQTVAKLVLNSYREALDKIVHVQEDSFASVEQYLSSVNIFLEGKNLEMSSVSANSPLYKSQRNTPSIVIKHENNPSTSVSMSKALSSGERQIATLIFAATRLAQQDVILIDEPEISLNVDWQRKLLPEMLKQMPSKQIIVCTHSPVIGARYRSAMIELSPTPTRYVALELSDPDLSDFEEDYDMFHEADS